MNLQQFLQWAQSEGISAIFGFLFSFIVEWYPAYKEAGKKTKRLVMLIGCLIIPTGAAIISALFEYQPWAVETFWPCIVSGFIAFSSSQVSQMRQWIDWKALYLKVLFE